MSEHEYKTLEEQHKAELKVKYDGHNRKPVKQTMSDLAEQARRRTIKSFLHRLRNSWNQRLAITHIDEIEPSSKYW